MAMWESAPGDWNLLCEQCGWSADQIETAEAANRIADEHLRSRH